MVLVPDVRPLFHDRLDAGRRLAERLERYYMISPVVCAIPRGGVPVGAVVADYLGAGLDLVVARKLGAPSHPEFAIGAVTADGEYFLDHYLVRRLNVDEAYLERVVRWESAEAQRQERQFRQGRAGVDVNGRTALLVPRRLVVAVPVGSRQACSELLEGADDVVCLAEPEPFYAVGMYYDTFEQVEDTEVSRLLAATALGSGYALGVDATSRRQHAGGDA